MTPLDAGSVYVTLGARVNETGFRKFDALLKGAEKREARAKLSFDVDEAGYRRFDAMLRSAEARGASIKLALDTRDLTETEGKLDAATRDRTVHIDADRRPLDQLGQSARTTEKSIGNLTGGVASFNRTMTGMRNIIGLVKFPAMIVGAGLAAQAISALTAGAIALVSALGPVVGALQALPGLAIAAGQGVGAAVLGFSGLGGAVKALTAQQDAAAVTAQRSARTQQASAQGIKSAEQQLQGAQRASKDAQQALTQSRRDAIRSLTDMKLAAQGAALSESRATISLRQAREELIRVQADPKATQTDIDSARLAVKEAGLGLKQAKVEKDRARRDNEKAQRQGVEGQPGVVQARRQLADANRNVKQSLDAVHQAQQAAADSAQQLSAQQNKVQQAMKNLGPAGREFAKFLFGLRKGFFDLRKDSQQELLPGVEKGIKSAGRNFGVLRKILIDTSGVIGRFFEQFGRFLGSKSFGQDFALIGERNLKVIDRMGRGFRNLIDTLRHIAVAAGPFLDWATKAALAGTRNADAWARAGRETGRTGRFLEETRSVMQRLWTLTKNLGDALLQVGRAGKPLGDIILGDFNKAAKNFRDFTHSAEGTAKLREYFLQAQGPVRELGRLVSALTKSLLDIGTGAGVEQLLRAIREDLLPAFTTLIEQTTQGFGPVLIDALKNVLLVISDLAGQTGPLTAFTRVLGDLAEILHKLLDLVPGLGTLVAAILTMRGLDKVLRLGGLDRGISVVTNRMKGLRLLFGDTRREAENLGKAQANVARGGQGFFSRLATGRRGGQEPPMAGGAPTAAEQRFTGRLDKLHDCMCGPAAKRGGPAATRQPATAVAQQPREKPTSMPTWLSLNHWRRLGKETESAGAETGKLATETKRATRSVAGVATNVSTALRGPLTFVQRGFTAVTASAERAAIALGLVSRTGGVPAVGRTLAAAGAVPRTPTTVAAPAGRVSSLLSKVGLGPLASIGSSTIGRGAVGAGLRAASFATGIGEALAVMGALSGTLNALTTSGGIGKRLQAFGSGATLGLIKGPASPQEERSRGESRGIGFLKELPGGTGVRDLRNTVEQIGRIRAEIVRLQQKGGEESKGEIPVLQQQLNLLLQQRKTIEGTIRAQSQAKGGARATDLQRAFKLDLKTEGPSRAIEDFVHRSDQQLAHLAPAGRRRLLEANLAWAKQQEAANPKLKGLYEAIRKDAERSFSRMGQNVHAINGKLISGTDKQFKSLGHQADSEFQRLLARVSPKLTDLQKKISAAFQAKGFSRQRADELAKALEGPRVKAHALAVVMRQIGAHKLTPRDAKDLTDQLLKSRDAAATVLRLTTAIREKKITSSTASDFAQILQGTFKGPISPAQAQKLSQLGIKQADLPKALRAEFESALRQARQQAQAQAQREADSATQGRQRGRQRTASARPGARFVPIPPDRPARQPQRERPREIQNRWSAGATVEGLTTWIDDFGHTVVLAKGKRPPPPRHFRGGPDIGTKDAEKKISNLSKKLEALNKRPTVTRILASSKTADEAVRRLRSALDRLPKEKKVTIKIADRHGGTFTQKDIDRAGLPQRKARGGFVGRAVNAVGTFLAPRIPFQQGGRAQRISVNLALGADNFRKQISDLVDEIQKAAREAFRGRDPLGVGRAIRRSTDDGVDAAREMSKKIRHEFADIERSAAVHGKAAASAITRALSDGGPAEQARKIDRQVSDEFKQTQKHATSSAQTLLRGMTRIFGQLPDVVSKPVAQIMRFVGRALDSFGVKGSDNIIEASSRLRTAGKRQSNAKGGRAKHAIGGIVASGSMVDSVDMDVPGGTPVLNRHQQPYAEEALRNVYGMSLTDLVGGRRLMFNAGGLVPIRVARDEVLLDPHSQAPVLENAMRSHFGYGLDSLFQREQRPHYMAKGGKAKTAGLKTRGTLSYNDLRRLAASVGFKNTDLWAKIALAESGGSVGSVNSSSGASGLWQILPSAHPQYNVSRLRSDALYNAQAAYEVSSRGTSTSPWTASRPVWSSRAQDLTPGGGTSSGASQAAAPKVPRFQVKGQKGKIRGLVEGAVERVRRGGQRKLNREANKTQSVPAGSGVTSTKGLVPQVKRALAWARAHGWHGVVTSGFRSDAEQVRIWNSGVRPAAKPRALGGPGSNHSLGQAIDVSDVPGFARAMKSAPRNARLLNLVPGDALHFSVTGHAEGGFAGEDRLSAAEGLSPKYVATHPASKRRRYQRDTRRARTRTRTRERIEHPRTSPFLPAPRKPVPAPVREVTRRNERAGRPPKKRKMALPLTLPQALAKRQGAYGRGATREAAVVRRVDQGSDLMRAVEFGLIAAPAGRAGLAALRRVGSGTALKTGPAAALRRKVFGATRNEKELIANQRVLATFRRAQAEADVIRNEALAALDRVGDPAARAIRQKIAYKGLAREYEHGVEEALARHPAGLAKLKTGPELRRYVESLLAKNAKLRREAEAALARLREPGMVLGGFAAFARGGKAGVRRRVAKARTKTPPKDKRRDLLLKRADQAARKGDYLASEKFTRAAKRSGPGKGGQGRGRGRGRAEGGFVEEAQYYFARGGRVAEFLSGIPGGGFVAGLLGRVQHLQDEADDYSDRIAAFEAGGFIPMSPWQRALDRKKKAAPKKKKKKPGVGRLVASELGMVPTLVEDEPDDSGFQHKGGTPTRPSFAIFGPKRPSRLTRKSGATVDRKSLDPNTEYTIYGRKKKLGRNSPLYKHPRQAHSGKTPKKGKQRKKKKSTKKGTLYPRIADFPIETYTGTGADVQMPRMLDSIDRMMGPELDSLQETYDSAVRDAEQTEETFVRTQDDLGRTVPPSIDQTAIQRRLGELTKLIDAKEKIVWKIQDAVAAAQVALEALVAGIVRRQRAIRDIKKRIAANLHRLKTFDRDIEAANTALGKLDDKKITDGEWHQIRKAFKTIWPKSEWPGREKGALKKRFKDHLNYANNQVSQITQQNTLLGGEPRKAGNAGLISVVRTDSVENWEAAVKDVQANLVQLRGQTGGWIAGIDPLDTGLKLGAGGKPMKLDPAAIRAYEPKNTSDLGNALWDWKLDNSTFPDGSLIVQKARLLDQSPESILGKELQKARIAAGPTAEQEVKAWQQALNDLRSQFASNVKFVGSFAGGGTVPGPLGKPALAIVHGQEEILDPRKRQSVREVAGQKQIVLHQYHGPVYQPQPKPEDAHPYSKALAFELRAGL